MENTYNERLEKAGIKTIYPDNFEFSRKEKRWHEIKLIYKDKEIQRPLNVGDLIDTVKKEFGLNI